MERIEASGASNEKLLRGVERSQFAPIRMENYKTRKNKKKSTIRYPLWINRHELKCVRQLT